MKSENKINNELKEYIQIFIDESLKILHRVLINIKDNNIKEITRGFHSLKGMSLSMELQELSKYFHQLEDLYQDNKNINKVVLHKQLKYLMKTLPDFKSTNKGIFNLSMLNIDNLTNQKTSNEIFIDIPINNNQVSLDMKSYNKILKALGEVYLENDSKSFKSQQINEKVKSIQDILIDSKTIGITIFKKPLEKLVLDFNKKHKLNLKLNLKLGNIKVDKTLLYKLFEPVILLLNNSLVHGFLESPKKQESSYINININKKNSNLILEINDNGQGFNKEKIIQQLIKTKKYHISGLNKMNLAKLIDLMIVHKVSTSTDITLESGRGEGLAAISSQIKAIGGSICFHDSNTIHISIPLNSYISNYTLVEACNEIFGIDTNCISSINLIHGKDLNKKAKEKVFSLANILNSSHTLKLNNESQYLVLDIDADNKKYFLIIDNLLDNSDYLIKNIPQILKKHPIIHNLLVCKQQFIPIFNENSV